MGSCPSSRSALNSSNSITFQISDRKKLIAKVQIQKWSPKLLEIINQNPNPITIPLSTLSIKDFNKLSAFLNNNKLTKDKYSTNECLVEIYKFGIDYDIEKLLSELVHNIGTENLSLIDIFCKLNEYNLYAFEALLIYVYRRLILGDKVDLRTQAKRLTVFLEAREKSIEIIEKLNTFVTFPDVYSITVVPFNQYKSIYSEEGLNAIPYIFSQRTAILDSEGRNGRRDFTFSEYSSKKAGKNKGIDGDGKAMIKFVEYETCQSSIDDLFSPKLPESPMLHGGLGKSICIPSTEQTRKEIVISYTLGLNSSLWKYETLYQDSTSSHFSLAVHLLTRELSGEKGKSVLIKQIKWVKPTPKISQIIEDEYKSLMEVRQHTDRILTPFKLVFTDDSKYTEILLESKYMLITSLKDAQITGENVLMWLGHIIIGLNAMAHNPLLVINGSIRPINIYVGLDGAKIDPFGLTFMKKLSLQNQNRNFNLEEKDNIQIISEIFCNLIINTNYLKTKFKNIESVTETRNFTKIKKYLIQNLNFPENTKYSSRLERKNIECLKSILLYMLHPDPKIRPNIKELNIIINSLPLLADCKQIEGFILTGVSGIEKQLSLFEQYESLLNSAIEAKMKRKYEEAIELMKKVEKINSLIHEKEDKYAIKSANCSFLLGRLYFYNDNPSSSAIYLEQAEQKYGNNKQNEERMKYQEYININLYISLLYAQARDFEAAEESYLNTIRLSSKYIGEFHSITGYAVGGLGGLYLEIEEFTKGEIYLKRAEDIGLILYGENHPDVAEILSLLSQLYLITGNLGEALDYGLRAFYIREILFGEIHAFTIDSMHQIAIIAHLMHQDPQSIFWLTNALQMDYIATKWNGPLSQLLLTTFQNINKGNGVANHQEAAVSSL